MNKWIKDGKVAVIVSPGFGAGWSTWASDKQCCMDGELAKAIHEERLDGAREIAGKNWPGEYQGGLGDCFVAWVPQGDQFEIREYDGSESLHIIGQGQYLIA